MAQLTKAERTKQAEAIEHLRELLQPGDTVYTVLRRVSTSGMSRLLDLYVIKDNRIVYLTGYACTACERTRDNKTWAMRVTGCGMDMGFDAVYNLSARIFGHDNRGAYALKHEWI